MKENKIYYNHSFYKRMPFTAYYDLGITFPVPSRYVRYHTPTVRTKYEIPYYNGISFNNDSLDLVWISFIATRSRIWEKSENRFRSKGA